MVPIICMIIFVSDGTHLPWGDYWMMVDTLFHGDGSTRFAGFLDFQNEHPVVIAKVLYWLNLRLGDGSNIVLGYVVVLAVAVQLVLINRLLLRSAFRWAERSLLLILSSALLFGMGGSWNFTKSMSGAAWLVANLFAVLAIYLRQNDRSWLAAASAAAATISYGTGLSAWPAVAVVGMARRPWREWWRELPMLGGAVVGYLWYQSAVDRSSDFNPSLRQLLSAAFELLGAPLRIDGWVIPVLAALVVAALAVLALVRTDEESAPWLGLAAYGMATNLSIAFGRWILIQDDPVSRYHSLAAMFWIGATATVLVALRGVVTTRWRDSTPSRLRITTAVAAVAVAAPMLALTWDITDDSTPASNAVTRQDLAAVALRLDLGEDFEWATGWKEDIDMDVLRGHGQYPFSSRWNRDCGLLGDSVDTDDMPEAPFGVLNATAPGKLPGGVVLNADVPDLESIRCVVAVAPDGEVVGAGVLDDSSNFGVHSDGARGFVVVALDDRPSYRIVVFSSRYPDGAVLETGIDAGAVTR